MSGTLGPTGRERQLQMISDALRKHFPHPEDKLIIDKVEQLVTVIVALVLGYLAKYKAVGDAHTAYQTAIGARKQVQPEVRRFLRLLLQALKPVLGADNPVLAEFSFKPEKDHKKPTTMKALEKVEKAAATRKERHTMGKRQKEGIKGNPNANNGGGAQPGNGGAKA